MSEIFETVNAHADAVEAKKDARKEEARRVRHANRRMLHTLIGVVTVWVLAVVLCLCDQISRGLAEFLASWAATFLAIWFGAWFQFRFCRKGLMK